MQHGNGYIDFAIMPQDFEAGLFELWAGNLLAAALPQLDSEITSVGNCAVFQFDIKDGEMKKNAIFADTTKMRTARRPARRPFAGRMNRKMEYFEFLNLFSVY